MSYGFYRIDTREGAEAAKRRYIAAILGSTGLPHPDSLRHELGQPPASSPNLADTLLDGEHGSPVPAPVYGATPVYSATPAATPKHTAVLARQQGYTGNTCVNCGSARMKVSGHCEVCEDCGTTTGCS